MTLSTRRPASRVATPVPAENGSEGGNSSDGASVERNSVVLGPRDRLVGELFIEGDLRVAGTVKGTIEATGDIEISGAGKVSGDITAYNRLTVGSDASLIAGDVRAARLTVEDGAQFSGKVMMGAHVAAPPKPAAVVERAPQSAPEPVAQPVPESVAIEVAAPVAELAPVAVPEPAPAGSEPVKAPPVKAQPAKSVPVKAEPPKPFPAKAQVAKAEPAKAQTLKAEPAKVEPVKQESVKVQPLKGRIEPIAKPAVPQKGKRR